MNVTGSSQLVSEGIKALEALDAWIAQDDDLEIAEVRIYENMPIEAVISSSVQHETYRWDGQAWIVLYTPVVWMVK